MQFCIGITLGIVLGTSLLIDVSKARPQNQQTYDQQTYDQNQQTISENHKPFLKETTSDFAQRFHENAQEVQQYGRKYADKQYLRPLANDEIAKKFLSFDIPDTIEAYRPELNKIADVPIYLGERRCGNNYRGGILPCLLRPEIPPFSYSTERGYNMEYKKK